MGDRRDTVGDGNQSSTLGTGTGDDRRFPGDLDLKRELAGGTTHPRLHVDLR